MNTLEKNIKLLYDNWHNDLILELITLIITVLWNVNVLRV